MTVEKGCYIIHIHFMETAEKYKTIKTSLDKMLILKI